MKLITLQPEQFDQFASKHRYRNYYQSSMYGKAMEQIGFHTHYLGIQDDFENLIGAGLILYEEVFMGQKYAYVPRGFLLDYSNPTMLKDFAEKLKRLLGKQGFMYLKMDPYIPCSIRDKNGNIINSNPNTNAIISAIKNAGFQHHGLTKFFEAEKARWEAITTFQLPSKQLYKKLEKSTRNKINKARRTGIEIIKDQTGDIQTFYEFVKNKHTRPINYYQALYQSFKEKDAIDIYFAKLNTEQFVINSKDAYERALNQNDHLNNMIQHPPKNNMDIRKIINQKMESDKLVNNYKKDLVLATNLLKNYPDGMIISAAIVIKYDNAAYLLIEGFNPKYKDKDPNYLLKWKIIEEYNDKNYKYFNLNAIVGEFQQKNKYSGLNEMKFGFHAVATEYIGEFDLIINPIMYNLYKGMKKKKNK